MKTTYWIMLLNFVFFFGISLIGQEQFFPELIPYRKGNKWGYCDKNKKIIIECKYDDAWDFYDGYARVFVKDKGWGVINQKGEEIIPCQYAWIDDFKEGKALIKTSNSGSVNEYANIDPKSLDFCDFETNNHVSEYIDSRYISGKRDLYLDIGYNGFVDKMGNEEQMPYDNGRIFPFTENFAKVESHEISGYIDTTYNEVIPLKFFMAFPFHEGLARVKYGKNNTKYGFVNTRGNFVIKNYDHCKDFSEGLAAVCKKGKWGFVNKNGKVIIPLKYTEVQNFSEGFAGVCDENNCFFIDSKDNLLLQEKFEYVKRFSQGYAAVCKKPGNWYFINSKGEKINNEVYENVKSFSEGLAAVCQNKKWGFINFKGELVIPFKYDYVTSFCNGLARVWIKTNNYFVPNDIGYIDTSGTEYWEK